MSLNYSMTQFNFKTFNDVAQTHNYESTICHKGTKSINPPQYLTSDYIGNKIKKAESIVDMREAVNKIKNTSSKNVKRRNIFDKDKSVYKNIMILNSGKKSNFNEILS